MWPANALLTLLLLALPLGANAAGLGKLAVLSALGQPLRAEVEISASREELASLSARIASPAAFQQAGIEFSTALTGIRFSIDQRSEGRTVLSMVSDRAFNEPFLDLLVELNWSSGRLVREYTFLLDPPELLKKPGSAPAAPPALPEIKREAQAAAPAAPAPATMASQPVPRVAAPAEDKPRPRADLQVIRGADGVQRIVKVAPPAPEKPVKETATRLVKHGDTLGKIAAETKPDGVNLDQMLVALFRGNQDAFSGNVNRLKAGKILTIPDRETVAGVDVDEARKTIQAHAADFNAYSKKLASTVSGAPAQKEEAPQRAVSGKIAPKVEDKAPTPVGKDKLEVSKSEAALGAAGKTGAGRLAAIEETLVSREKALKDANSRIAELEKNLQDLKKLVELKNQSMADLQAQAAKPVVPLAAVKEPVAAPQQPVATAAEKPAETVQSPAPTPAPAKPAEPAQPAETAKPAPVPPPAAPKPAPVEQKPVPPPPVEPSFVDESPEIVYGGGAILVLLLGYFGYSRWRKQQADTQAAADDSLSGSLPVGASSAQAAQPEDLLADFNSQAVGVEPNAAVDPIAEADVYLAYGRDVQAEEILVDALKANPTRLAIHLKLLEIYAARKSVNQFGAIASDLHGQTGGMGPDWEKARQLGQQLDPENPLYAGAVAEKFDPEATMVIAPKAAEENLEVAEPAIADLMPESPASEPEPVVEAPAPEEVPVSLDFDFDLPLDAQVSAAPGSLSETPPQEELSSSLDIDLNQDVGAAQPAVAESLLLEPEVAASETAAQAPESLDIDFDLDLGASAPATVEPTPTPPASDSSGADAGLDFNFDLGSSETPAAPAPAEPAEIAAQAEPVESNLIDFDLELPAPAAETPETPTTPAPAATNFDLSSISLDLDQPLQPPEPAVSAPEAAKSPDLDDSALQDVATKLELAQAYEEMGDKEGARELLQEVLNEGNAAQQETARNKLAQLD
ncbi:MAG: FimV/HubP family polar landmark protein [Sterolibacterium sp.]